MDHSNDDERNNSNNKNFVRMQLSENDTETSCTNDATATTTTNDNNDSDVLRSHTSSMINTTTSIHDDSFNTFRTNQHNRILSQQQQQLQQQQQPEPSVFLVPLSNDEDDYILYNNHRHNINIQIQQQQELQDNLLPHPSSSYYSAPTDEEESYYRRRRRNEQGQQQQQHPNQPIMFSFSNNNDTVYQHNNNELQQQQQLLPSSIGTTAMNPIILHANTNDSNNIYHPSSHHNDTMTTLHEMNEIYNSQCQSQQQHQLPSNSLPQQQSPTTPGTYPSPSTMNQTTSTTNNRINPPVVDDEWNNNNNNNNNNTNNNNNDDIHSTGGGRLWRLAGEVAAGRISLLDTIHNQNNNSSNKNGPVRQIKESFLERMRSRADPDAYCISMTPTTVYNTSLSPNHNHHTNTTTTTISNGRVIKMPIVLSSSSLSFHHHPQQQQSMSSSDTDDIHHVYREDEAFLINTGLAHKRVRVVQLMIIGLFGILLPWMGNVFVSSSCNFASIHVVVGTYGNVYPLHFGLWNYTPISSALNGYKYCYPYYKHPLTNSNNYYNNDDTYMNQYPSDPPIMSRIFNSLALLAGTYSLAILWWYLISGRVRRSLWKFAVYMALSAGIFQFATPIFFFLGRTCLSNHCSIGPGTVLSAVTAIAWIIFGAELHYHCPISTSSSSSDHDHNNNTNDDDDERIFGEEKTPRHDNTASTWMSRTGNYLWNDVRSNRTTTTTTHHHYQQQQRIDVSQLEMSDFASASQQYFNRFYPPTTSSSQTQQQYHPPTLT